MEEEKQKAEAIKWLRENHPDHPVLESWENSTAVMCYLYAEEKTRQQQEIIERSYKLFKRILDLEKLWMPTWTKDPPVEHLDEAIALKSISKVCKMLIEKIEAKTILKEPE